MPTFLTNRKAHHNYEITEDYEAGIKLLGHEVKAIKEGKGNLTGSYVKARDNQLWLVGFNLAPYSKTGVLLTYDPTRPRKLLLNRKEINSLIGKIERQGYTLVPLRIYSKRNLIKVSIGLGRGKKKWQKKEDLIKKQQEREIKKIQRGHPY